MGSLSPLQIVFIIIAAVSIIGVLITLFKNRSVYGGYEEIQSDVRRISAGIGGEIFRDGEDLVINGNYQKLPVVIRFSNAENTPGLNIRMQAPTTFRLTVFPSGESSSEAARAPVRTTDEQFDARFQTRSDQPTQAKMFLDRQSTELLKRTMCSKNTFFSIGGSALELSELVIPQLAGQHVMDHLKTFGKLDAALKAMPGADTVKVVPLERERQIAGRRAIAIGSLVALLSIFAATRTPQRAVVAAGPPLPAGVLPVDAASISNVRSYRLATEDDFDPTALQWMRANGVDASGRLAGDFSGTGHGRDAAYILIGPQGERRLALLVENANVYDALLPSLAAAAILPKDLVSNVRWKGGDPPQGVTGDGLVLVRQGDDHASAVVLFVINNRVASYAPINYQDITLR